jgi:preprotein translocase subunit YajC
VGGFLILVVILAAVWALLVLPSKRRRGAHAAMQDSVEVGDDIITAGGLHGVVKELDEDTARVEIAPGVVATLDRRAIAAVAREIEVEATESPEAAESPDAAEVASGEERPGTAVEPS